MSAVLGAQKEAVMEAGAGAEAGVDDTGSLGGEEEVEEQEQEPEEAEAETDEGRAEEASRERDGGSGATWAGEESPSRVSNGGGGGGRMIGGTGGVDAVAGVMKAIPPGFSVKRQVSIGG